MTADPISALAASIGERVAVPKEAPADSFVLHAPLELLARTALYRYVDEAERPRARTRLEWFADTYDAAGDPVVPPRPLSVESPEHAARILVDAITAGELDDVDRAASALADCSTPDRLRGLLGPHVVASLAAAAHASILLWLLPRVDLDDPDDHVTPAGAVPRARPAPGLAHPLVRSARRADQRRAGRHAARRAHARGTREQLHLPDHEPGRGVRSGATAARRVRQREDRCAACAQRARSCRRLVDVAGTTGPGTVWMEPLPHHAAGGDGHRGRRRRRRERPPRSRPLMSSDSAPRSGNGRSSPTTRHGGRRASTCAPRSLSGPSRPRQRPGIRPTSNSAK